MKYRDAIDSILNELPGIARATAVDAMRESASEFCRQTLCWRETERTALIPNINRYMAGDSSGELVHVFSVKRLDGSHYANAPFPIQLGEVVIDPPRKVTQVSMEVALAPPFGSKQDEVPEALNRYIDAVLFHTKWKLKSQTGMTWSDPQGAVLAYQQYMNRKEDALHDQSTTTQVKFRRFF